MASTLIFLPGESQGQRNLAGYSPWGHRESDTTERLTHTILGELMLWFSCSSISAIPSQGDTLSLPNSLPHAYPAPWGQLGQWKLGLLTSLAFAGTQTSGLWGGGRSLTSLGSQQASQRIGKAARRGRRRVQDRSGSCKTCPDSWQVWADPEPRPPGIWWAVLGEGVGGWKAHIHYLQNTANSRVVWERNDTNTHKELRTVPVSAQKCQIWLLWIQHRGSSGFIFQPPQNSETTDKIQRAAKITFHGVLRKPHYWTHYSDR